MESFRSTRFVGSTREDRTCSLSCSLRTLSDKRVLWAASSVGVGAMVVVGGKDDELKLLSIAAYGFQRWEWREAVAHAPG